MGIPATFMSITLLTLLAVLVVIGARYARHKGHLQNKGGRYAAVAVIVLLAIALWVGPAMFLA